MTIIKNILRIIIVIGILSGSFLFFDDWQLAAGFDVLLLLLIGQILFLASKTTVRKNNDAIDTKRVAGLIKAVNGAKKSRKPAKTVKKRKPVQKSKEKIDSDVFSAFQENLKRSQATNVDDADITDDEQDVVVSLSSKSKKKSTDPKTTSKSAEHLAKSLKKPSNKPKKKVKPQLSEKVPTETLGSIFDDIKEPMKTPSVKVTPKSRVDTEAISKKLASLTKATKQVKKAPLTSNETLSSKDLKGETKIMENEAEMVLSVAENTYREGDYEGTLASIRKWFQTDYKYNTQAPQNKNLLKLKADCEFSLIKYENAASTYQEYFKKHLRNNDGEYLEFLQEVTEKFTLSLQQHHAVQFYFTALNEYRQAGNHEKMDDLYNEVETAYRNTEDWPRLIQTYQNHLSIKKMLGDYDGQLVILDHLGKLQYDQGDAEGSKKSYEQSIAIKNELSSH